MRPSEMKFYTEEKASICDIWGAPQRRCLTFLTAVNIKPEPYITQTQRDKGGKDRSKDTISTCYVSLSIAAKGDYLFNLISVLEIKWIWRNPPPAKTGKRKSRQSRRRSVWMSNNNPSHSGCVAAPTAVQRLCLSLWATCRQNTSILDLGQALVTGARGDRAGFYFETNPGHGKNPPV